MEYKKLEMLSKPERAAVEERRKYQNEWRAKNKDRVKEYNRRYWLKKAAEQAETSATK